MRTPEQRRAYIDTSRRSQPHRQLELKAFKARGRSHCSLERVDLIFARDHGWTNSQRPKFNQTFKLTFCSLCSTFAEVGEIVQHKPRCSANPFDDGPYPGWTAAGGRPGPNCPFCGKITYRVPCTHCGEPDIPDPEECDFNAP